MHGIERQASLCFEVFRCAARIRAAGSALRLLNRDYAVDPVDLGNNSRLGLLGQSRRAEREGRSSSQNDLCNFQGSLPASGEVGIISRGLNGSAMGTSVGTHVDETVSSSTAPLSSWGLGDERGPCRLPADGSPITSADGNPISNAGFLEEVFHHVDQKKARRGTMAN